MRIAVTGANGFVGVHLTRRLFPHHDVLAIDNLRYGPWRFTSEERTRFKPETLDIRDRAAIERALSLFDPQAIIHLAALHFIPECERFPDEAIAVNVAGTVNLLAACKPSCRFVFTSSAAVYAPKETDHHEREDQVGPVDVYGFTKLHAEHLIRHFSAEKHFQSVIVRLFNVVGPGETNPHVLPEIIRQLRQGSRTLKLGNVQPKRDYVFVKDVAAGLIAAATEPLPEPSQPDPILVNLGSGKSYSVEDIVRRLATIIGEPIQIEIDQARVRQVDRPNLLSNCALMLQLFSWMPAHDIDQSLRESWMEPGTV